MNVRTDVRTGHERRVTLDVQRHLEVRVQCGVNSPAMRGYSSVVIHSGPLRQHLWVKATTPLQDLPVQDLLGALPADCLAFNSAAVSVARRSAVCGRMEPETFQVGDLLTLPTCPGTLRMIREHGRASWEVMDVDRAARTISVRMPGELFSEGTVLFSAWAS